MDRKSATDEDYSGLWVPETVDISCPIRDALDDYTVEQNGPPKILESTSNAARMNERQQRHNDVSHLRNQIRRLGFPYFARVTETNEPVQPLLMI